MIADATAGRRVMIVYGTRPEAIKVAPLIRMLQRSPDLYPIPVVTGQHREMLDQVNSIFSIVPEVDLDILSPGQGLDAITAKVLLGMTPVMRDQDPDAVVVQGDTTTAFAAGLAAFYLGIPVVHLEAGLRTGDLANPFPEELNRTLLGQFASLHLAPTRHSRDALVAEGIDPSRIHTTGNTVIDALFEVVGRHDTKPPARAGRPSPDRVLVTLHRRESWGEPMRSACEGIAEVARLHPRATFTVPRHLNPVVRDVVDPILGDLANVHLTEPMGYAQFCAAMAESTLILTDSGGVQEEAPSLGVPVLVLRETTERPEAVEAGTVRLIGTDSGRIVSEANRLLDDDSAWAAMAAAVNPYGDGRAAQRAVDAIAHSLFGIGERPEPFDPRASRG